MLPTLWEQFGDDPFLFQNDCTPVTKARSIKTWMSEFPAQSPDLNPIEHLWDELERRLRARPSHPTSVPDLTNALLEDTLLNLVESLPRRVEAVIAAKGGTTPYYIHVHVKADVTVWAWLSVSTLILGQFCDALNTIKEEYSLWPDGHVLHQPSLHGQFMKVDS
ncbi:hypothetical protein QTP70_011551 [Hemibagrus guttatus]|uniref:Tc1-like transposase DDE domain-containing protein n=1 Tax=Hemibagrus guttatus TaxID=175788 RepID=A0AAE0UUY4_9TELE|nr:hypothetical protein QTP70_011551 [Hemibagrus guttatus]